MIHRGWVDENGELHLEAPEFYRKQLESLRDRRVKLELKRAVPSRTLPQNSYYWGPLLTAAESDTGQDRQTIHETLKEMHLEPKIETVLGKQRVTYSTQDLSIEQMSEYIEKCKATLAHFGVSIPQD